VFRFHRQANQVGGSSRIVIRGNSSFGDNQPLIVVDGIPFSNGNTTAGAVDFGSGLYDINPQNIESVTVLKGGAAAALYGMRAGNGVILITTKAGKSKTKGVSVEYDGNFNVDQVYSIQKFQNKYGQGYLGDEWSYKEAQADGYSLVHTRILPQVDMIRVMVLNMWMVSVMVLTMVLTKAGDPVWILV
jgi:TonB-dependent SusC/RagA subfamily outer membrane receptor